MFRLRPPCGGTYAHARRRVQDARPLRRMVERKGERSSRVGRAYDLRPSRAPAGGRGPVRTRPPRGPRRWPPRRLPPHHGGQPAGPPHGLLAVKGHRRDGAARRPVDHEAGAAEPLELANLREQRHPVEVDAVVDLLGRDPHPDDADAGARRRGVVAVQHRDLPLLDLRGAAQRRDGPIVERPQVRLAGVAGLPALPGARDDAVARPAVHEHGQPDAPFGVQQGRHDLVANAGDARVDRRRMSLDRGGACVHGPPPSSMG
jgi:hypothetical protein